MTPAWKVEVLDLSGTSAGTHVTRHETAEGAIKRLATFLDEPWPCRWTISGAGFALSGTSTRKDASHG